MYILVNSCCPHFFIIILQDLLSLSVDSQFESQFFSFRRMVQQLEKQLGQEVGAWLHRSSSLQTQLRIMEMFQYSSQREVVKVGGSFAHSLAIIYVCSAQFTD